MSAEEKNKKEDSDKFKILLESVKSKIDFASDAARSLDGKAGVLMGIESAIAIGYLSFAVSNLEKLQPYLSMLGLLLLILSIFFLMLVVKSREYTTISVDVFEHKEYWEKSEADLLRQLIADTQNAFAENSKILKKKQGCLRSQCTS